MLGLLLAPVAALAVEPVLDATLSGAAFAAGAEVALTTGVRQPLWDRPGDVFLEQTWVQAGVIAALTPAYTRAGLEVAMQPATFFELRASYQLVGYFGLFNAVVPFDDPDAAYDPDTRQGLPRTHGWGRRLTVQPTIRAQLGPIAMQGWSAVRWGEVRPAGIPLPEYWLEPELSLMVAQRDVTVDNNALLVVELLPERPPTLYTGIYTTLRYALGTGDRQYKAGPAVVYTTPDGHWTLYGVVQAYIEDRTFTEPLPPFIGGRVAYSR